MRSKYFEDQTGYSFTLGPEMRVHQINSRVRVQIPSMPDALKTSCRASGQNETADDFLARSLYALELAWPASFLPGSSTLSASVPENLPLFKTLFKYIQVSLRTCLDLQVDSPDAKVFISSQIWGEAMIDDDEDDDDYHSTCLIER